MALLTAKEMLPIIKGQNLVSFFTFGFTDRMLMTRLYRFSDLFIGYYQLPTLFEVLFYKNI